jgi:retron-type reverse transcriptase
MGAIFFDIEKAFDKVWHNGLLFTLNKLQVPDYLGKWIRDYLTGRSFRVRVDGVFSTEQPISAGVPQGSVLGPILFNIFFNSIHDAIPFDCDRATYADDLSAWFANTNLKRIERHLQSTSDSILVWMNKWRTKVSKNKTVVTVFKPSPNMPTKIVVSLVFDKFI